MYEPLRLRDDLVVPGLLVVRLGVNTMTDASLLKSVEECHRRWGVWGFSVFEVPDGDYAELAKLRPNIAQRRQLVIAMGADLVDAGFPLLPTLDSPHWTVSLSAPTNAWFERVRSLFQGPIPNPAFRPAG